jgi:hypothetical protein
MNWIPLLLVIIAVLLGFCEMRLAEILGELQDLAHRGRRLYPLTQMEREHADDAAEADAWAQSSGKSRSGRR